VTLCTKFSVRLVCNCLHWQNMTYNFWLIWCLFCQFMLLLDSGKLTVWITICQCCEDKLTFLRQKLHRNCNTIWYTNSVPPMIILICQACHHAFCVLFCSSCTFPPYFPIQWLSQICLWTNTKKCVSECKYVNIHMSLSSVLSDIQAGRKQWKSILKQ
jgi:hypothetical protein